MSFPELHFLGKMALLALRGRPQPLKKPSQSQKGHFYEKMNALNDTKTPEMAKSAKETGNICDRLWHLSECGQKAHLFSTLLDEPITRKYGLLQEYDIDIIHFHIKRYNFDLVNI